MNYKVQTFDRFGKEQDAVVGTAQDGVLELNMEHVDEGGIVRLIAYDSVRQEVARFEVEK